jgi:Caspase domain
MQAEAMETPAYSSSSAILSSTEPSDPNESPLEDITETHLRSLREFANDLNVSSEHIVTPPTKYEKVFALIAFWPDAISDRKHIKVQAQDLWHLFKDEYGFNVGQTPFEIPEKNSHNSFAYELLSVLKTCGANRGERDLFILYYGGHAESQNGEAIWSSSISTTRKSTVRWHDLQSMVEDVDCDVVMLFDCCYGGAMIACELGRSFKRRCELLSASAKGTKASGREEYSFTKALVGALRRERMTHCGSTIARLHKLLNNPHTIEQYKLKVEPNYQPLSSTSQPSTRLTAFKSAASPKPGSNILSGLSRQQANSDARVMLKITFEDPTENPQEHKKEFEDFLEWRPGNILAVKWGAGREDAIMHAFFKASSTSAIVSMPMELWDLLPRKPAYEFLSVVRSLDLRNKLLKPDKPIEIPTTPLLPQVDRFQSDKAKDANAHRSSAKPLMANPTVHVPGNKFRLPVMEVAGRLPVTVRNANVRDKKSSNAMQKIEDFGPRYNQWIPRLVERTRS